MTTAAMKCAAVLAGLLAGTAGCATYRSRGRGIGLTEDTALTIIRSTLARTITERGPGDLHSTVHLTCLTAEKLAGAVHPARTSSGGASSTPYTGSSGVLNALDPLRTVPPIGHGAEKPVDDAGGVPFSIMFARIDDVYVNSERHIYRTATVVVHERDGIETEFPAETIQEAQDLADAIAFLRDNARNR